VTFLCKKSLKIPNVESESVNRSRTDNAMAKRQSTKGQTKIDSWCRENSIRKIVLMSNSLLAVVFWDQLHGNISPTLSKYHVFMKQLRFNPQYIILFVILLFVMYIAEKSRHSCTCRVNCLSDFSCTNITTIFLIEFSR
jgi:hypothetical protein